jgi:hypothetical protein
VTVACGAPDVVQWLVTAAVAPLEERNSDGNTPLLRARRLKAWAVAHALLVCGARADAQSTGGDCSWSVLLAAQHPDSVDSRLLQRLLMADPDSLLGRRRSGLLVADVIVSEGSLEALKLLLGSGLPGLAAAANARLPRRRVRQGSTLQFHTAAYRVPITPLGRRAGAAGCGRPRENCLLPRWQGAHESRVGSQQWPVPAPRAAARDRCACEGARGGVGVREGGSERDASAAAR